MQTAQIEVAAPPRAPLAPASSEDAALPAAIATLDGSFITAGLADITATADGWTATLKKLDRPGVVASMFFAQGLREVLFRCEDGREARARIAATTFTAGNERECRLMGDTPFANNFNL